MEEEKNKCVVVTGFGPFKGHDVNASWVAVKELSNLGIDGNTDLIIYEIPVVYETVKKIVPDLWKKHSPVLMVHVGVSSIASQVTLEQQAHNDGYTKEDFEGSKPASALCIDECCDSTIVSGLNMTQVCESVNQSGRVATAVVSHDPGRYLCDFSYFLSLNQDKNRAAFVHVPPLDKPYSANELGLCLQQCIQAMMKQLKN